MVDTNHGNHGWILMLDEENPHRSMLFASSDNDDPTIRPRLKVYYRYSGLGLKEGGLAKLQIYPDPAEGELRLSIPNFKNERAKVEIWNLNGQKLRDQSIRLNEGRAQLSLNGIPPGSYFLQVHSTDYSGSSRLIVMP